MTARRLWRFVRPEWPLLAATLLVVVLGTAAQLALPPLAGAAFNEMSALASAGRRDLARLNVLGLLLLAALGARSLLQYAQIRIAQALGQRAGARLRETMFAHVQRWSLDETTRWPGADLIHRVLWDTQGVRQGLIVGLADIVATALFLIGIGVAVVVLDWRLAGVAAAAVAASMALARAFGRRIQDSTREAQALAADLAGLVRRAWFGARVIRAFAQEDREVEGFRGASRAAVDANLTASRLVAAAVPLVALPALLAVPLVIWIGGRTVAGGALTVGGLFAFIVYLFLAQQPASDISRQYAGVRQALASFDRVLEVLDRPRDPASGAGRPPIPRIRGEIVLDRVSLEYEPGVPVLREVSVRVAPGERVAIVGPSGAGKTSLAGLIPRFRDPTSGRVLIDGCDLRAVSAPSVRRQIGLVPQEVVLFAGTVRDNIAYGRPGASLDEVIEAATAARAHEFVARLPAGYDTVLAEDAADLSGGQRQRLAIARALLVDPRIIILDEATSSLDAESEALIRQALDTLMRGRTTIIIAHRLSTVRSADRILVLQEGRVIEEGTHRDLLALDGLYTRLSQWQVVADLPGSGE